MKSKTIRPQNVASVDTLDSYRTRVASLPFPLIVLIIILMGIAKYFG